VVGPSLLEMESLQNRRPVESMNFQEMKAEVRSENGITINYNHSLPYLVEQPG
jgi:hypothetical protein